ncbi:hypothetical protein KDN24_06410 [Bacillus sp. Bva_UNVM-123]|uniref:LPD25 domain-containing protein n=1 Tax=Bacillus sp. Bva_UNVM-123 TaxID=2829798 RepID=UPI00391FA66D
MTKTIQLQGVGSVSAVEASEIREGDMRMYNFGSLELVVKVIEKSSKTLTLITFDSERENYHIFDIRRTTLVCIVKSDQEVSMHKPMEIKNRKGEMVDVSEYFQTDEKLKTPEKKIEVKEITFLWSESNQVKDNTTVKTFEEAEQIIFNIAIHKDTGGYDKTQFKITWEDGHTYTGRIDVLSSHTSGQELKKNIENHCTFFAGERKGYHVTMEDYENTLRAYGITEDDKKEYRLFLDTYMLEDVNKEKFQQTIVEENETIKESLETNQSKLNKYNETQISESVENAKENTVTYITGTGTKGNGIEVKFSEKPSEELRNAMKANGYKWGGKNRPSIWWAILTDETISLAKQLTGEEQQENAITGAEDSNGQKYEYPEVEIDDSTNEKYNIPQSIQDQEHDANWIFRQSKTDHNKEIQSIFSHYTNEVKKIVNELENDYYIYKIKSALQSFKKKYHNAYVKWLSAKGAQPHWAVSGRGNLSKSRYDKIASRQDKWMFELVGLPEELKNTISYYKNKARKDKENKLKEQLQKELKQHLPDLTFKTTTKEVDIYGNGSKVKSRIYECEGYFTLRAWGAFRVYESATGKELWSAKSNGTLKDAKAYISILVKKDRQEAI